MRVSFDGFTNLSANPGQRVVPMLTYKRMAPTF
jgi:hypothetical protein